jgi:uncharacterized protein
MLRVLLLLAVVIAVVLWWKHQKRGHRGTEPAPGDAEVKAPEAMLRCAECGLHLPASQSLPGRGGVFCSTQHRQQFEARG